MPKMREINTPLKPLGIRYFKDEEGLYYQKRGKHRRKQVKPFWKKKRMWLGASFSLLLIIGIFGYHLVMNLASKKVVDEVSAQIPQKEIKNLLMEPSVQQTIENQVGPEKKKEILQKYSVKSVSNAKAPTTAVQGKETGNTVHSGVGNVAKPKLMFTSRDQAMKFLLSKFTASELAAFADKAKDGLTPQEKSEITSQVLSRLTPEEYNALKTFAVIEVSKS
ncbi:hypothetical protein IEC97_20880 [Neobacillus cucumis]|uniref:hypothetical protein n=1 Tax=Neobacillus cucumis TaxID=1740721 RepID=UPI0018E054E3|nr:hypothetical protein [Neobacillus cucumis]MBI0579817.1 hypothetical protein [Neobacillus cucumis]